MLLIAGDQPQILTAANVQGSPALVIEILSPGTGRRDEGIKRKLFDEKGVREYWMVDPKGLRVSICRRASDGFFLIAATLAASTEDELTTPLLPGFALSMRDLFAECEAGPR